MLFFGYFRILLYERNKFPSDFDFMEKKRAREFYIISFYFRCTRTSNKNTIATRNDVI